MRNEELGIRNFHPTSLFSTRHFGWVGGIPNSSFLIPNSGQPLPQEITWAKMPT